MNIERVQKQLEIDEGDLYNEIFNVCLWLGLFFGFLGLVGLICNHSRVKK